MTEHKSGFLQLCQARGLMHQCTDAAGLDDLLSQGAPIAAYIGFDCTAPSLHVGSLIQIMMLRRWQQAGHKPIILMGGATTKVGDPSGKDKSRPALSDDDIAANMAGIRTVFEKFIRFGDGATDAVMVNNDDWLSGLKYIEFLRDYGRHFSINRMMTMDSVKLRLEREQPLSFLEFNYMILQAFDFMHLSKSMRCRLQIGGSDQWGNIINGTELSRRSFISNHPIIREWVATGGDEQVFLRLILALKNSSSLPFTAESKDAKQLESFLEKHQYSAKKMVNDFHCSSLFGLTTPLFTNSAGAKMGKTADGAVWLNADLFKPYDYWQFWRNAEDAMVEKYLLWFTDLEEPEIAEILKGNINEAKKRLATEATAMLHGKEAATEAAETARKTFELGLVGEGLPEIIITSAELQAGIKIVELFVRAGLAESNGEAKKLIQGGGAKLNDEKISDAHFIATSAQQNADGVIKLSAGKKRHAIVKIV